MRRALVMSVAVLSVALAGCTGRTPAVLPTPTPPPPPTVNPVVRQVCEEIAKINGDQSPALVRAMIDEQQATDDAGRRQATDRLHAITDEWAAELNALVARTDDGPLREALAEMVRRVGLIWQDVRNPGADMDEPGRLITQISDIGGQACR